MTLKSFRTTTGISVKELSDKTGISVSALYAYEKENALPSREVAVKLADVYKIPLYDLMPLEKNEKGVTRAAFEEQAEDFKAKYEPDKKSTPQTKETPKPTPRKEETRDPVILETTLTLEPPLTPQVKAVTHAEYLEAASGAMKALRAILGSDINGQIMLAVGFVTAEIESKLFIERVKEGYKK